MRDDRSDAPAWSKSAMRTIPRAYPTSDGASRCTGGASGRCTVQVCRIGEENRQTVNHGARGPIARVRDIGTTAHTAYHSTFSYRPPHIVSRALYKRMRCGVLWCCKKVNKINERTTAHFREAALNLRTDR